VYIDSYNVVLRLLVDWMWAFMTCIASRSSGGGFWGRPLSCWKLYFVLTTVIIVHNHNRKHKQFTAINTALASARNLFLIVAFFTFASNCSFGQLWRNVMRNCGPKSKFETRFICYCFVVITRPFLLQIRNVCPLIFRILVRQHPLPSNRQQLSYDVCLEVRGEIIRTVLCCIVYWSCAQS